LGPQPCGRIDQSCYTYQFAIRFDGPNYTGVFLLDARHEFSGSPGNTTFTINPFVPSALALAAIKFTQGKINRNFRDAQLLYPITEFAE
jgi:hypothetical protein